MKPLCAALIFLTGCAAHVPPVTIVVGPPDFVVEEAGKFVMAIAEKMPEWDEDKLYAQYETKEIAKVKADILLAKDPKRQATFLDDVDQLNVDWDALCVLDQNLHKMNVI
jgi:hypothetical protein